MMNSSHMIYVSKDTKDTTIVAPFLSFGFEKEKIKEYKLDDLWDFKNELCSLSSLIAQPQYFNQVMVEFIIQNHIECLYLEDRIIGIFFEKELEKFHTMTDLSFLNHMSHLKCLKIDMHTSMFSDKPVVEIDDFTPIERLKNLECLSIPDSGHKSVYVDIDFSKLIKLRNVSLQFSKRNKTIFQCPNIEEVDTRYYYDDLTEVQNWKKIKKFDAYFDKLKSFEGIEKFKYLKEFKGEFTSSLQSFEGLSSQSIKTFYYYTEARKTPVTLKGISGLKNVETIKLSGLKKLNSIADLPECKNLKEFWLEESNVPDDIEEITNIKSLKKVFIDYPEKVMKKFPKLKLYMS